MIVSEDIAFTHGADTLVGTIDWNTDRDAPTILSMHGSRPGSRANQAYLTKELTARGYSCLRFDFGAHGDSPGNSEISVNEMTAQAVSALQLLDPSKPITVIGSSLSGHIAVALSANPQVKNIVLLAPALYMEDAANMPYSQRSVCFDNLTGTPVNFPITAILAKFKGRMLHIIGAQDDVIPSSITTLFHEHSQNVARREFIVLTGAPHRLSKWLPENTAQLSDVIDKIIHLIEA